MLSYLRQKKGTNFIKGLLVVLSISFFSGFGLLGYCTRKRRLQEREANTLVKINETGVITRSELARAERLANRQGKAPTTEAAIEKQRQEILDRLINQKLVLMEAERLGIKVTEDEINARIYQMFQRDGKFDPVYYKSALAGTDMTEEEFRKEVANDILTGELQQAVAAGAIVTDDDVMRYYRFQNEQIKLDLIKIDPDKITDIAEPTRDEIVERFNANEEGVMIPEKRVIKYTCLKNTDMVKESDLTRQDLYDYYESAKDFRFAIKPRQVKALKIYFAAPMGTPEEQRDFIKQRAQTVLAEVKKGEKSFEDLATQYSDDAETAAKGGDMGWVSLSEAGYPAGRALQGLKPGETSDLVTGIDGFYIFKVENERAGRYKPFRSVRNEVVEIVRELKGRQPAKETAQKIIDDVGSGVPFDEAVEMATAEIKISEPFEKTATAVDGMEASAGMVSEAYKLWDIESVATNPVALPDRTCVLQLADIEEEHFATLEEAIPVLKKEMVAERREEKAKELGEKIIAEIKNGTPFESAAGDNDAVEFMDTDFFARGKETIPGVGYSPDMVSAAFALPPHDPVAYRFFEVNGKYYIMKMVGKKEADADGYNEKYAQLKLELMMERQKELLNSWIESLKKKAKIARKDTTLPDQSEPGPAF